MLILLQRLGIPHSVIGKLKFHDRAEIKDLVAYFTLATDLHDDKGFERYSIQSKRSLC